MLIKFPSQVRILEEKIVSTFWNFRVVNLLLVEEIKSFC